MATLPVDELFELEASALEATDAAGELESLAEVEREYLGKKGSIRRQMRRLGQLDQSDIAHRRARR